MALPTVDARDLNMVQLSPEVRRALKHRADEAARRAWQPVLQADRAAFQGINQDYRTQAQSVKGATNMVQNSLAQALGGLEGAGLEGNYLRQTQSELTSRMGDAAQAIPFLLADARENRADAFGEARGELQDSRAAMLQDAATGFNSLLKEARTAGSSELEEQKNARAAEMEEEAEQEAGGGLDISPEALKAAELELKDALRKWSDNPTIETPEGEEITLKEWNPLHSDEDWDRFAIELSKEPNGPDLVAINEIIERLRPQVPAARQAREHQGVLPQPGVPGAGSWAAR